MYLFHQILYIYITGCLKKYNKVISFLIKNHAYNTVFFNLNSINVSIIKLATISEPFVFNF